MNGKTVFEFGLSIHIVRLSYGNSIVICCCGAFIT